MIGADAAVVDSPAVSVALEIVETVIVPAVDIDVRVMLPMLSVGSIVAVVVNAVVSSVVSSAID